MRIIESEQVCVPQYAGRPRDATGDGLAAAFADADASVSNMQINAGMHEKDYRELLFASISAS